MELWNVLGAVYVTVALFAISMTWHEQVENGHRNLFLRALGFLLCLLWPVLVPVVALVAWRRPA